MGWDSVPCWQCGRQDHAAGRCTANYLRRLARWWSDPSSRKNGSLLLMLLYREDMSDGAWNRLRGFELAVRSLGSFVAFLAIVALGVWILLNWPAWLLHLLGRPNPSAT